MSRTENTDELYKTKHAHEQEEASGEHKHPHEEDCCHEHEHHHKEDCHCSHEHHHDDSCHCEHEYHHDDGCRCGHEHHHDDGCRCGHDHEHGGDIDEMKEQKNRLIISGSLFLLFLFFEHVLKLPFMENRLINTLLYLIPYLIVGWDVIREAIEGLLHGEIIGEQFLMVVASAGAFAIGENAEAAAVLILYCLGELFQDYAVHRSRASISELMDLTPETANLVTGDDGTYVPVKPEELSVGDTIVILPGEKVPVDGTVISGSSMLDTSSMTGESVPRQVRENDPVISGCINGNEKLTVRVDKEYEDSTAAKVMELTEEASERKSPTENFVTRFARIYTPAVVIAAVCLAVIPPLVTGEPFSDWFARACTFLVISCPCALVISVPLSFFGGLGAASKYGIMIKGSNFLEALTQMKIFASDKTGTLTKGEFRVTKLFLPDGRFLAVPAAGKGGASEGGVLSEDRDPEVCSLLRTAAEAEYFSDHPIANSIKETAEAFLPSGSLSVPSESSCRPGYGMTVTLDGSVILAGSERLMLESGIDFLPQTEAGTKVYLSRDGQYLGLILISDTVKPEAKDALRELKENGVRTTVLLTGDTKETAEYVKEQLALDEVRAELLPRDKVSCMEEYLSRLTGKEKLAYAGDGVNDAPVLARADIGIAMGSLGSDAAIEAADVVIMDDNILKIPTVIRIAKKTLSICRQNILFILLVKLCFLILGAFGITNMWMAVFADVGVAMLCVLNSMRMLLYRDRE